jgi:hypothetical protein
MTSEDEMDPSEEEIIIWTNFAKSVGRQAEQEIEIAKDTVVAATGPKNLSAASDLTAGVAVATTLTGQLYIAGPSAIISTTLGYAAAVQEDNPVQAVAVETIVNFTAKPIGIISKGAASI